MRSGLARMNLGAERAIGQCAMVSSTAEGPDFICVGMPKAGTDWLLDQVQYHPDFWMPPVKGLHYLNRGRPGLKDAERRLRQLERRPGHIRGDRRAGDERDIQF